MRTWILLGICLLAAQARAAMVTLAWDASPTPGVSYRVKWGFASGTVNQTHVVEAGTGLTVTITEPWAPGTTVYFNVFAWNEGGESLPDGEVSWTVPIEVPTPTPIPSPTAMPTPEPPSNLRIILDVIISWIRDWISNV